ncbi:MAG: branched-chain amino acid ABC transporter permease [Deltaproteobacteria bacterium]
MTSQVQLRKRRLDRGIKARTDSVFVIAAPNDLIYVLAPRVVPILFLMLLPLLLSGYEGKILVHACVIGLLAMSWDLLASCGLFSLGQSLFFGVGAYLAGTMNKYGGAPIWLTLPLATIGGGVLSAALLAPVVRLRGVYFAMVTLMLPLLFRKLIEAWGILGGTHGISSLSVFPSDWVAEYLAIIAFLGVLFGLRKLIESDYGLVLKAIRDDDRAVMSAGINIYSRKVQALFLAGAIASFAGAFMTHHFGFVGFSVFAWDYAILPVAATTLGGPGAFAGAALGSMILLPLSEFLRAMGGLRIAIYCCILIACVITLPEGLFSFLERKYHQFETVVEVK